MRTVISGVFAALFASFLLSPSAHALPLPSGGRQVTDATYCERLFVDRGRRSPDDPFGYRKTANLNLIGIGPWHRLAECETRYGTSGSEGTGRIGRNGRFGRRSDAGGFGGDPGAGRYGGGSGRPRGGFDGGLAFRGRGRNGAPFALYIDDLLREKKQRMAMAEPPETPEVHVEPDVPSPSVRQPVMPETGVELPWFFRWLSRLLYN